MNVENAIFEAGARPQSRHAVITWVVRHRWFALLVVVPLVLATLYYGLIASDEYVSESRFVVKSAAQRPGQLSTFANLIQTTGLSAGEEQANEVLTYIRSRGALADLQKNANVRAKFMSSSADRLSRFPGLLGSDTFESLYKFYDSMVNARMEKETGVAIVEVRAFTPQDAHDINEQLLRQSETLVNRLNERAQHTSIAEAELRVVQAETRVRHARISLGDFRNDQDLLDPTKQATGVMEVANKLLTEQVALQAQLELMRRVAPQNPSIPALEVRVAAMQREIGMQNGRAVGTKNGIASKLGNYEQLAAEQEFATQNLAAASAALEQARVDAQKQQFYLERVVEPNTPDMALFPHRLTNILTIAGALICLYFIGWMLVVGILEHAPED